MVYWSQPYGKESWIRYDQTRNAIGKIKQKAKKELMEYLKKQGYNVDHVYRIGNELEDCGVSAFLNSMDALGFRVREFRLKSPTGIEFSFDDAVTCYVNTKEGLIDSKYAFDNRYQKIYPKIAKDLFNCKAEIIENISFKEIMYFIKEGNSAQLNEPGHYTSIIGADYDKMELIINDSWGTNPRNKNKGLQERVLESTYENWPENKKYIILYHKN